MLGIDPRTGTVVLEGARSRRVVSDGWASRSGSGRPSVPVDENADDIKTFDLANGFAYDGHSCRLEPNASIEPNRAVALDVGSQHTLQPAMRGDPEVIEALGSACLDTASPNAFARGARTGVRAVSVSWDRTTSSDAAVDLVSRSLNR